MVVANQGHTYNGNNIIFSDSCTWLHSTNHSLEIKAAFVVPILPVSRRAGGPVWREHTEPYSRGRVKIWTLSYTAGTEHPSQWSIVEATRSSGHSWTFSTTVFWRIVQCTMPIPSFHPRKIWLTTRFIPLMDAIFYWTQNGNWFFKFWTNFHFFQTIGIILR